MRLSVVVLGSIGVLSLPAFAADRSEDDHQLSIAGGIAAPACSTAVFQNPAGLTYNSGMDLTVQAGAGDDLNDPLFRGGVQGGNGDFGAAALLGHSFNNDNASGNTGRGRNPPGASGSSGMTNGETDAYYGAGLNLDAIKSSIGVAGKTALSPNGGSTFNVGTLIHPKDPLRVGATAIGVNNGVEEWGLGLAAQPAKGVDFVLDNSIDNKTAHFATEPALAIGDKKAAVTVGYGFNGGSRQLSDGFAAGGSVGLGGSTSWQVYYNNPLGKYYTGISFGF